jgi:hypothetical protein
MFARSLEKERWDADQDLQAEAEPEQVIELPAEDTVLLANIASPPGFSPDDLDQGDYYTRVIKTAIENGGKYMGHQIPVPWLRMILAGLEHRQAGPDTLWYDLDEGPANLNTIPR